MPVVRQMDYQLTTNPSTPHSNRLSKTTTSSLMYPTTARTTTTMPTAKGFCCNDGTLEAARAKVMKKSQLRVASRSFKDPDNYENLQFFYHPDHLGSSGFITNLDGEVIQHIEYVPFGEVFIEERNSVWNTPTPSMRKSLMRRLVCTIMVRCIMNLALVF